MSANGWRFVAAVAFAYVALACGCAGAPRTGTRAARDPATTYVSPYAPGGVGARASAGRTR